MSTNLHPDAAKGLFQKQQKNETEAALDRATGEGETAPASDVESSEDLLRKTVESTDSGTDKP